MHVIGAVMIDRGGERWTAAAERERRGQQGRMMMMPFPVFVVYTTDTRLEAKVEEIE